MITSRNIYYPNRKIKYQYYFLKTHIAFYSFDEIGNFNNLSSYSHYNMTLQYKIIFKTSYIHDQWYNSKLSWLNQIKKI